MKKRWNRIERLVNDVGVEFEDEEGMKNVVLDYFHQLFKWEQILHQELMA
jgi:hypothetical protein